MALSQAAFAAVALAVSVAQSAPTEDMPAHYLVGLLNYPNSFVPEALKGHTSGTAKAANGKLTCMEQDYADPWCDEEFGPWGDVPSVGFSDIEFFYGPGGKVLGEFWCTTDNGFGSSSNSWDYPLHIHHMHIQKPFAFNHGGYKAEKYTEAASLGVTLLTDPDRLIRWENGADIQVEYFTPDATWDDWKAQRVLTGRDFDLEGMAARDANYAIMGEELMPALFAINPTTGVVLTNFVRTPDIDMDGQFNGKFLSSSGDKVHCDLAKLPTNECLSVPDSVVDASEYVRHGSSGGYEGLAMMGDGSVAAFIERNAGSTLAQRGEPGIRVYRVQAEPLMFEKFSGWYKFEPGSCCIADVSPLPGSQTKIAVVERNNWPGGKYVPGQGTPNNRVCIIDLNVVDEDNVFVKHCVLNYQRVQDPFDADGDGLTTAAFNQWTTEQVIVIDDWCMITGTDTNYPSTNQFGLTAANTPDLQQVADTRWMVVCFNDAIFGETAITSPTELMPAHYLVGLLNYPNSFVPEALKGHTSGTAKAANGKLTCMEQDYADPWCDEEFGPWGDVPSVGFSDIEFFYGPGGKVLGEFWCTTDNGFGSSSNSWDYPLHIHHMHIQKPFAFNHGGYKAEKYTEAASLGVTLLTDPDRLIRWENGADIQVEYFTPDATWDDWKAQRVLTGRDFDLEGMAARDANYAIMGEELMPALFAINPTTGVVLTNFVRTPDIDMDGQFNGKFLSSSGDKVHCDLAMLPTNECLSVPDSVVDASEYVRHGSSGGYEGLAMMGDGSVATFIERNAGSTLAQRGEPGIRVYRVQAEPLMFEKFSGWYKFEPGSCCIADVSPLPGSQTKIAVVERNNWPGGKYVPGQGTPNNRVCIIDLNVVDEDNVFVKHCVLNYQRVQDPFDADGDGLTTAAFNQWTTEQVIVIDDWCMIAGTDTNYPSTNQFGLNAANTPDFQQVSDTRWMVVCFNDAVFGDVAAAAHLADSHSWHKNGDVAKDCAWVKEYAHARCDAKGSDKSYAKDACVASCATYRR